MQYLGSTVVKELRGTESTRKSIQKLKRGERSGGGGSSGDDTLNPKHQFSTNAARRPVCIAISQRGVLFIDIESQGTICEHEIRNINCACQDSDDLSHFAYITKDSDNETHYCHVFSANSMVSFQFKAIEKFRYLPQTVRKRQSLHASSVINPQKKAQNLRPNSVICLKKFKA